MTFLHPALHPAPQNTVRDIMRKPGGTMRALRILLASLLFISCTSAAPRDNVAFLNAADPGNRPYSDIVRVGNLLFLSGKIGTDPATGRLVPGGITAETRQTLEN